MWIARDKSGDLYLYKNEPVRMESFFTSRYVGEDYDQIDDKDLIDIDSSKITWEDGPVFIDSNSIKDA